MAVWIVWASLALLPAWSGTADAAGAMRCDSRIIDRGTLAALVLGACGEPDYRDIRPSYYGADDSFADTEEWYYDFGPNQLLRVVRLRNGRVVEIDADGYGFGLRPSGRCAPLDIVDGLSKYRLLVSCGEPLSRQSRDVLLPLRRHGDLHGSGYARGAYTAVRREEWVYNFGARYLMRVVTLENGRVVDVENGDRGFD